MSTRSVQFAVAAHLMTALGWFHGTKPVPSRLLAASVRADPTFVRKAIAKLVRAGLVVATRGKNGSCALARPPEEITLDMVYRASESPAAFAVHAYPIEPVCPVSANIKDCLCAVQLDTQRYVEAALANVTVAQLVADVRARATRRGAAKGKRRRRQSVKRNGGGVILERDIEAGTAMAQRASLRDPSPQRFAVR